MTEPKATPLVSVVIPIYNIESLVRPCIESVLSQTYPDLDILLVDDGSTDSCAQICDEYQSKDSRVRALHKENGGIADARNFGIEHARGELLTFIDGDDIITPEYVAHLVAPFLERDDVDMSTTHFVKVLPDQIIPASAGEEVSVDVLTAEEALRLLFLQKGITTSAWAKMYRPALFDGIRYPTTYMPEDLPVTYRLISASRSVACVNAADYLYVQHPGSFTSKANYAKRLPGIQIAREAVDFVADRHPAVTEEAKVRAFMEAAFLLEQVPSRADLEGLDASVKRTVKTYQRDVLRCADVPLSHKAIAVSAYCGANGLRVFVRAKARLAQFLMKVRGS